MASFSVASIFEHVRRSAEREPERLVSRFLRDGEVDEETFSIARLDVRARAIAAMLGETLAAGERVLLLVPPGHGFLTAFLGCLYARVIAVPVYPPVGDRPERTWPRTLSIIRSAGARCVLTTGAIAGWLAKAGLPTPGVLVVEDAPDSLAEAWRGEPPRSTDIAFLQYTSGSTGEPKGVVLSHANLEANLALMRGAFGLSRDSRIVIWLPPYHDMGLIGGLLQALDTGCEITWMAPDAFLQRPRRWLAALSRYRGTFSGGPNFAYDMCVRRIPPHEREGLDLSDWQVAANGSEPVRADTMARFFEAFAPCGLRRGVLRACYGLAEATLLVSTQSGASAAASAEPPPHAAASSGAPAEAGIVTIVDPESRRPCAEGALGEIWVRGPSVGHGYWGAPEATAAAFGVALADTQDGSYLRTGDLGFLWRGEVFVTSRLKDLLILRGAHHFPQDLEATAGASHPALRPGNTAAFVLAKDGEDLLVVAQEVSAYKGELPVEAIARDLRAAVLAGHNVHVDQVVLLRSGTLPKTSSGKIRRSACREGLVAGTLAVVGTSVPKARTGARVAPRTPLEARIAALWADVLGVAADDVGVEDDFFVLGGHSLLASHAVGRMSQELGRPVSLAQLYAAPTIARLAELLAAEPSPGERPLSAAAAPVAIAAASPTQARLWLFEQLNPGTAVFSLSGALVIEGALDRGALERALHALVARHAALRTVLRAEGATLVQAIAPEGAVELVCSELAEPGEGPARRAAVARWAEAQARAPFDLERGPLLRAALLRVSATEHVLALGVHHGVADGWSVRLLLEELGALFTGAPVLPPPSLQLPDFTAWQHAQLESGAWDDAVAHWRRTLEGAPTVLELPTDFQRPAQPSYRAATLRLAVPPALTQALEQIARREGATLFMVLFAAYLVFLERYTQQTDLVVGVPVANRGRPETARMIGLCANVLPLRCDLAGVTRFRELLRRVRELSLAAGAHQEVPFEVLLDRLAPPRDPSRAPLFQVMFALQNLSLSAPALGGLAVSRLAVDTGATAYDLSLLFEEGAGGWEACWEYAVDLFAPRSVQRMADAFQCLLEGVVADPDRAVREFSLVRVASLPRGEAPVDGARDESDLLALFRAQAARTPEAIAVSLGEEAWSYAALQARAGAIAASLRQRGLGVDDVVGLCLPASLEFAAALLAATWAGVTPLLLDLQAPPGRLALLCRRAGAKLVLTRRDCAPPIAVELGFLDDVAPAGEPEVAVAAADALAYVTFTSGSTGEPKGVMIPRRGIARRMTWEQRSFPLEPAGRVLQVAPLGIDTPVWELFRAFLAGGRVVVASEDDRADPARLVALIRREAVTEVCFVPSALRLLLDAGLGGCSSLRRIVCVGEALTWDLVERLLAETKAEVFNFFGQTEASLDSLYWRCQRGEGGRVPIGRPIDDVELLVLDPGLQLTPPGAVGELYLGGPVLARGYLGGPGLTAERFVPHPLVAGARLYRTGDLVRHRADGELEFFGRSDDQVKLRGARVELEEVRARLESLPGVEEAAVLVVERGGRASHLVAYAILEAGAVVSAPELRAQLRQALPDVMVPAAIRVVEQFPRTASGKVDRRALLAREAHGAADVPEGPSVRSPTEEMLQMLWAQLLRVPSPPVNEDFFALGGHSLLAMQLVHRIRELFGVELSPRRIFEARTIAELAPIVDEARRAARGTRLPRLVAGAQDRRALSFAQQRLWFIEQLVPELRAYNSLAALRLTGALDLEALARSLTEIVRRHEVLRTTFSVVGGQPQAVVHEVDAVELPVVDVSALPLEAREERVRREALALGERPFDLARELPLRVALVRVAPEVHALLVCIHHIASDGWSAGILWRELAALYPAYCAGAASPLPELPVQYADFAGWQRDWLAGAAREPLLAYWEQQLAGAPAVVALPRDFARPPLERFVGRALTVQLPAALTEGLERLSLGHGCTLFMTLLAAFKVLLFRYSGQTDIVVGTDVAGRDAPEVEGLIGFFVNQLVLRTDLAGAPSFAALLERVRRVTLEAYDHRQLPFDVLVERLQPERSLAYNPLFQVDFTLHTNDPATAVEGHAIQSIPLDGPGARFDLEINASREAGGLKLELRYNSDLFAASTVERLARHYQVLLEEVVADPARSIVDLPLLRGEERARLLASGELDAPAEEAVCAHHIIAVHAARTPAAIALKSGAQETTYAELEAQSNRIAQALVALGAGLDDVIAVVAPRDASFWTAVLGVWKAGAAYLPLDPRDPPLRHIQMLGEGRVRRVLASSRLRAALEERLARLPAATRPEVLDLDALLRSGSAEPVSPPRGAPRSLAYVIFTSGSTGLPKGAMVEHAGMLNHLRAKVETLGLSAARSVAQTASQCFDISVWQLFAPLIVGGCAHVMEDDLSRDPALLLREIQRAGTTVVEVVPSLLRGMLDEAERLGEARPQLPDLRWLVPTGEALPPELCRRWFALYPGIPLLNAYGPTECSDDVTHHAMSAAPGLESTHVPIGRPVRGTRIYVLDRRMEPVPVGAVGELFVGGAGVGRGYLRAPSRTAVVFVPDPYGPPGARLYSTGDLARVQADGAYVFIGRRDTQVKIRGHRIELGEIERVLADHAGVAQAAVQVQESGPERRLVAYVVPAPREASDDEGQRELVGAWGEVFDDAYRRPSEGQAVAFRGWNSAYTSAPIPDAHMKAWVAQTVARIRGLAPRRALEPGCGAGLLLEQLAPACERYVGTDLSPSVLADLGARAARTPELRHVALSQRAADDFTGFAPGSFDTVIINSVAQYFPSADYLVLVLQRAAQALAAGGTIFLGDVRNLALQSALQLSIELFQPDHPATAAELAQAVRQRVHAERELVLAPAFFSAVLPLLGRRAEACLLLKRGREDSEMNRFRFDVFVRVEPAATADAAVTEVTWTARGCAPAEVAARLAGEAPEVLVIHGVPDQRVLQDVRAHEWLLAARGTERVDELLAAVAEGLREEPGVHPEVWWELGAQLGYAVAVGGASLATPGRYDVALDRTGDATRWLRAPAATKAPSALATNPLLGREQARLEPALRTWVRERLPEAMVPSTFLLLDAMPLTPNGKLDRRALPAASGKRPTVGEQYVAPRTATEEVVATIWAAIMHIDRVGVRDDFFELGGHSLIATQLIARIRDAFAVEISVRALFEDRTVAAIAARVDALRAEARPVAEETVVAHAPDADGWTPVAPYQLPEWYLHELDPRTPFYNISLCNFVFTGPLDVDAFVGAWQRLVDRHASLRACFDTHDGRPMMRILPRWPLTREGIHVDRRDVPEEAFHDEVQRLVTEYSSTAFDFTQGPPFRLGLAEFSGDRFLLLFVVHHIIWDEASTMLLVQELGHLYRALRDGSPPALPALAHGYADFSRWIWSALERDELQAQRRYWLDKFREVPPALALPLDRPRPAVQTFAGDEVVGFLPAPVLARIEAHARRHGTTLFIFLLAVLDLLLHRWTGQEDFVVGSPVENRRRREWQGIIGMFATAMPLRCTLSGAMAFEELLRRVHATALEAYDNAEYPSVLAIQEIAPEHDPARPRLFSVMYGLQHDKRRLLEGDLLTGMRADFLADVVTADAKAAPMDLTVIVDFDRDRLLVRFNYKSALFERRTMERALEQFLALAEQAVAAPETRLAEFALVSPEDARLLARLTPPPQPRPGGCLHHLFEAQAARTPERVALVCGDERLTYRELDQAAERWAGRLRAEGIGLEDRVGVLAAPSVASIVALFAVLKSGAAYVPLNPEDPPLRHRRILAESRARWLLTPPGLTADAPGVRRIVIEADPPAAPAARAATVVDPRNAAYVLYTSGTTGAPRGITVEHAGLVGLLAATQDLYGLTEHDAVLLLTPLTFDASVLELFWPLSTGARVVVPPPDTNRDAAQIKDAIVRHEITWLQVVPTLLGALLEGDVRPLRRLRWVICGGAYMPRALRDRFVAEVGVGLFNHYGPTEVTVDAARFDCRESVESEVVPIGGSVAQARLYLVSGSPGASGLQRVPPGVLGELCVASPGLARGYEGSPGLTAAAFVPDPFSPTPGARMFRTGDIGRVGNDGVLHFMGRRDHQVKVRGNRVELAEIEARLAEHPGVRGCAVRLLTGGVEGLVAHVELSPAASAVAHGDATYHLVTLEQRRDLARQADALHAGSWPGFFEGDAVMRQYWPRLAGEFPAHQFVLLSASEEPIAVGNAVPAVWDGTVEGLPAGWDEALAAAFSRTQCADTLLILTAVIAPQAQGTGLSTTVLRCFKRLARAHGFARVVVAVRPSGKASRPDLSFEAWVEARRPDGLPVDDWLRAHVRVGGRILGVAPRSQRVEGTLAQWERWAGRRFTESGEYEVPGAFRPVTIDVAGQRGVYEEPAVWVEHPLGPADDAPFVLVDRVTLRAWLRESVPAYMVPEHFRFVPALPLTVTGKLDEAALAGAAVAPQAGRVTVPPTTEAQRRIAEVWTSMLALEAVGVRDDFFELGGHSILAVQMLARVGEMFERRVTLRQFFLNSTIQGVEAALDLGPARAAPADVAPTPA